MDELVDVLDATGNKTGLVRARFDVHTEGLWHRTVHVWVVSDYTDIFLQKRTETYYLGAGYFDATVVGHIQAGEESVMSAQRECIEELGFAPIVEQLVLLGSDPLSTVGSHPATSHYSNNEHRDVYVLRTTHNIFDFKFDTQEMKGLELVTHAEFGKMVSERDNRLVPQWNEYEMLLWYLGGI